MVNMPTKCPLTGVSVGKYINNCSSCTFFSEADQQCRIISIDNNLKTLLSILQHQQKQY